MRQTRTQKNLTHIKTNKLRHAVTIFKNLAKTQTIKLNFLAINADFFLHIIQFIRN